MRKLVVFLIALSALVASALVPVAAAAPASPVLSGPGYIGCCD